MPSVVEHPARHPSNCFAASPPITPSLGLNNHPVPNEEAVASDSSLSQNCTQTPRSTPASSFSIQRASPSTEVQSSNLEHCEDIELSSLPSHGYPGESSGNHTLPSVPEEDSQQHDLSGVIADHDASTNTLQPLNRQRTYTMSLRESFHTVQRYVPSYETSSTTIALIALALTTFFGYQTYQLTRIGTGAQLLQMCIDAKEKGIPLGDSCRKVLDSTIGSPYVARYEDITKVEGVTDRLSQPSTGDSPPKTIHPDIAYRIFILLGLMFSICLLICICMALLLAGRTLQSFRKLKRSSRNRPNAFDPVHVRLTHPHFRETSAGHGTGSESNQRGGRRRIIHGIQEESYEEYKCTRKRSFQQNVEMFLNVPFWKRRSLGRLECSQPKPVPTQAASIDSAVGQVGDALKGNAPDDLILPHGSTTEKCRRALQKTYSLFHDIDSEDIDPPLTALLADPEPEEEPKRKVAISSGVVALGLVQAGSTLASSVGGGIGPEILVKSESIERMDGMTPTPILAQDTFATGFEYE